MKDYTKKNDKKGIWSEDGQVRVSLSGVLNLAGLSSDLQKKGYFLANDPWDVDSQGWGKDQDLEGYYPYWVYRDGDRWVFAFTPEGYHTENDKNETFTNEKKTKEVIDHWVTYLQDWISIGVK
ncbi:MAG: hypothetical protein Q7J85_15370 [Bacillota bacterium]|nr:hypothetical protein [Bacillota bacterium]